jgi:hypothetical protein
VWEDGWNTPVDISTGKWKDSEAMSKVQNFGPGHRVALVMKNRNKGEWKVFTEDVQMRYLCETLP